jgi:hypothetical protein
MAQYPDAGIRSCQKPIPECRVCHRYHDGSHREFLNVRQDYFLGKTFRLLLQGKSPADNADPWELEKYEAVRDAIDMFANPRPARKKNGRWRPAHELGTRIARWIVPGLNRLVKLRVGNVKLHPPAKAERFKTTAQRLTHLRSLSEDAYVAFEGRHAAESEWCEAFRLLKAEESDAPETVGPPVPPKVTPKPKTAPAPQRYLTSAQAAKLEAVADAEYYAARARRQQEAT